MPKLNTIINRLISREGGYANHRHDKGGETNYGITQATARRHGYKGSMRDLPRTFAVKVYRLEYWEGPHFDELAMVSGKLAEYLFDYGVHSGPARAIADFQRCLNILNRGGLDYDEVHEDAVLGPMTLAAAYAHIKRRGDALLLNAVASKRISRFMSIAENDATQLEFLPGWINRALNVTTHV